jgi:diguanylate cyclase (GGDEF)-like protein
MKLLPATSHYFEPEIEALYHARQNERALHGTRILLLMAAAALVLFAIWDHFADPGSLRQTLPVRALGTAIILVLWGGTHHAKLKNQLSWFFFGNTVTCTTIVAWVLVIVPNGMVQGFPNFFFVPLSFAFLPNYRAVAFNCIVVMLIVNGVQLVQMTEASDRMTVINTNIFLSAMCAVTGLFAWVNEVRNRQVFALEIELERLATTDPLSGALNRRHFTKCAEAEMSRSDRHGHELALLLIDIDHFKNINDTHGHQTGDEAIRALADTCRAMMRRSDYLGRMGGEEFAILLPETNGEAARQLAERLRVELSQLRLPGDKDDVKFTVSIGVAHWRSERDDLESLLRRADTALYEAKRRGRNQVVVCDIVAK